MFDFVDLVVGAIRPTPRTDTRWEPPRHSETCLHGEEGLATSPPETYLHGEVGLATSPHPEPMFRYQYPEWSWRDDDPRTSREERVPSGTEGDGGRMCPQNTEEDGGRKRPHSNEKDGGRKCPQNTVGANAADKSPQHETTQNVDTEGRDTALPRPTRAPTNRPAASLRISSRTNHCAPHSRSVARFFERNSASGPREDSRSVVKLAGIARPKEVGIALLWMLGGHGEKPSTQVARLQGRGGLKAREERWVAP